MEKIETIAALELGLPLKFVQSLAATASYQYKSYTIPKRTGGSRLIHHPSKQLKALQRWLIGSIVANWPVHEAAQAYRKGSSTWKNASRHAAQRYLLRIDFKDFFPSFSANDIDGYLRVQEPLWSDDDRSFFTNAVCRHGQLTIGAPTSPGITNAICYTLDQAIATHCKPRGVFYTRYADDLFFSTNNAGILKELPAEVARICGILPQPTHLELNASKTRHSSKKRRRRVTGISLGTDGKPHVPRELKRKIRTLLFKGPADEEARARLAGLIGYVMGLEPEFINKLVIKYGAASVDSVLHPPKAPLVIPP